MAGSATVGTLNVEVALQLARLQADFDKMKGMVRENTRDSNAQFRQMGREGAKQFEGLRGEIEKTAHHLERAFSGARFAHGILGALGIGTGAAAVEGVFHKFEDIWKESARYAKEVGERAERLGEEMRKLAQLQFHNFIETFAPERKMEELNKNIARLRKEMAEVESTRSTAAKDIATLSGSMPGPLNRSLELGGRYGSGDEHLSAAEAGARAQAEMDKAQQNFIRLAGEMSNAQRERAEARKKIDEDHKKDLEKITTLTDRLAESQRKYNELTSDQTPEEKVRTLADRVAELDKWLTVSRKHLAENPNDAAELKLQIDLVDRLTEATRQLAEARGEVARKGEAAADKALQKLHEQERLQEEFQNAIDREREKITSAHDKANTGAGVLGQHGSGDERHHIEKEQLTVLKHIEQLLARARGPAMDMVHPQGYMF